MWIILMPNVYIESFSEMFDLWPMIIYASQDLPLQTAILVLFLVKLYIEISICHLHYQVV